MGRFFDVVSPFSTNLIDRVYLFKSNDLPALHVSKMLGYEHLNNRYRLGKYIVKKDCRKVPGEKGNHARFIKFDDLPKIMEELGRDPEDLKLVFEPAALPIKKRDSSEVSAEALQKSAEVLQKSEEPDRDSELAKPIQRKRDRDPETDRILQQDSDPFVKEFAKRYLAEHPDQAQKLIIDTIVKKHFDEIIKKLE